MDDSINKSLFEFEQNLIINGALDLEIQPELGLRPTTQYLPTQSPSLRHTIDYQLPNRIGKCFIDI